MRCGRRDTVQQEAYKKQESITGLQFLTELPNFVLVLASAVASHSLIVWLDFVDTLGNLLSEAIVAAQSRRMSRDLRYEYNYGVGKIEALTTFSPMPSSWAVCCASLWCPSCSLSRRRVPASC